jgi:ABC-2 type transport system ATP-binding protein
VSDVLSVSALAKRYGSRRAPTARQALEDVSFRLAAGELVALLGPNGAGKTTLLSILAGVQAPTAGTVSRLAGAEPSHDGGDDDDRDRGRGQPHVGSGVGWVPQQPALYSKLSAAENLELFARLEGVAEPRVAVAEMLAQTGLVERAHEPVARLSGGNRQRVNVALGLIAKPSVLALDEPSASLDPGQRERLWQLIRARVAGGVAVLFSTHDVNEAQRYASRVLVLADGRLLFDGPPAGLIAASPAESPAQSPAATGAGERRDEAPGGEGPGGELERALVRFLDQHDPPGTP